MLKRLIVLVIAAIYLPVNSVHSMETVKVVVLPFEIHASEALSYLASEIPRVIKNRLKREGAVLLTPRRDPDAVLKTMERSRTGLRKLGAREGADFVIWGSLTWTDEKFRLEATLISSLQDGMLETFVQEGEGIENLLASVTELARDLSVKMVKRAKIVDLKIVGNKRIASATIKRVIKSAPGEIYRSERVPEDIKAIYAMGYFDDIRGDVKDVPGGKSVVFTVKEKQTIRQILIHGNDVFEDRKIMESIDISTGSILNTSEVEATIDAIRELYKGKNYHNVEVTSSVRPLKNNQADLMFVIKEGGKILVKAIIFEGNDGYTDGELKDVMKTSEKGTFSWITSSGNLKLEDLDTDIVRLRGYYHNSGYISAKVDEPEIQYDDDSISITIRIDEGLRFKVGKVDIAGDLVETKAQMMKMVNVAKETYYNRETVRNDITALTDLYADAGYAYAEIISRTEEAVENKVVHITYDINKGEQVHFEKINITGNTRTKDRVIRRELIVEEQGLFSGKELKRSIRNLHRLGFFEPNIKVETSRGSTDDTVVLNLAVKEQSTTAFILGGVYSDYEGTYIEGQLEERNFLGRGSDLRIGLSMGGISDTYYLRYIEPWLFDIPLSTGIEVYKQDIDYITYDLRYTGFSLGFSYPISDFTRVYLSYRYNLSEITNFTFYGPDSIENLGFSNTSRAISTTLRHDSRDRLFDPTEGGIHGITFEYAGFGGDIGFAKTELESGYYIPIRSRLVGSLHGKAGYIQKVSGKEIPDYERFYLGGVDSMRGFDYLAISPVRTNRWGLETRIGGNKYVQFNLELLFTMVEEVGMLMVLFYDTGNVFDDDEGFDLGRLRHSAGYGFRWYSPMGLIRIENGYILDPEPGESSNGGWVFTIGSTF